MGTDIHGVWQKKIETGWEDVASTYEQDRHYLLFAWLGDVRNGFGFAGVPTHTPVVPLSAGRGLPEDFEMTDDDRHPISSLEVMDPSRRKYQEAGDPLEIWMGDHSFSWLSADEILAAPLPSTTCTGIVDLETFKAWDGKMAPSEWCGGIDGRDVAVSAPDHISETTTHVQISWSEDLGESLKYFVDEVRRLKELHGEVRFVFGFDS